MTIQPTEPGPKRHGVTPDLTEAACKGLPWGHTPPTEQRQVCATCPAIEACEQLAMQEVSQATRSERSSWASDRSPDVWAGRTLTEWVRELGEPDLAGRASGGRKPTAPLRFDRPKRYCPRGHDTHEVGVYAHGQCVGCSRERDRTRPTKVDAT